MHRSRKRDRRLDGLASARSLLTNRSHLSGPGDQAGQPVPLLQLMARDDARGGDVREIAVAAPRRPGGRKVASLSRRLGSLTAAIAVGAGSETFAGPAPDMGTQFEVRGGLYDHSGPFSGPGVEKGSVDVNLEFLSPRPPGWTSSRLSKVLPRLEVGGTLNTVGKTSLAYGGAAWTWDFGGSPWFVEPDIGVAWQNGYDMAPQESHRLSLGCSPLFHTGASAGYRLSRRWAMMATWEHSSNGGLCSHNEGLNNAGVRFSYAF